MKAIQVKHTGGPEVMELVDLPVPVPKANEVVVKLAASGINFIDVYHREGRYKVPLPFTPGQEGAGTVTAVGADVTSVKVGDRVAWCHLLGAYAEYSVVVADRLVPIPAGVTDQQAAAAMLQGMTAQYLAYDTYPLKRGETALVHAAAGGVGLLLTQMAHNIGARVIATVSTDEKAKLAREAGADEIIFYTKSDFEAETKQLDRRKGRRCRLRFGGQDDVRKRPEYSASSRNDGAVRRLEWRGACDRSDHPDAERFAVPDAAVAGKLRCDTRGSGRAVERRIRDDYVRQTEAADRVHLSVKRGAAGAPRSGRTEDNREVAAVAVV